MNKTRRKAMTHAEEIMWAVATFLRNKKGDNFSIKDIRDKIGVDYERWRSGYSSIFQGMRSDNPGKAPSVKEKFRNVFKKVKHAVYTLTDKGKKLL